MSEYLRKILGAGKTPLIKSQPLAALTADAGPDIPGGEGANKGFWRKQLRDPRTKQFIPMDAFIICTINVPGVGIFKATGQFKGNKKIGIATIRVAGNKNVPDGDYQVPHTDVLGAAEGMIKQKDLDRVLDKADGVIDDPKNILPPGTPMAGESVKAPVALKKAIDGEEALSKIKGEAALVAKEDGRFPIARGAGDIKTAAKRQYAGVFEALKKEQPDLVKDFNSFDEFWAYADKNIAIDASQRWADSVDEIPELTKATNRIYARDVLGMEPDGLITFYRNSINHHNDPNKAAAGYISLDQRMAWNYNSDKEQSGQDGRYIVRVKPDEVLGLLGYSRVPDEYGVVVGMDVTSQEGRYERVGDLAWSPLNPLMDPTKTQMSGGGDSWFRQFRPASSFDFPVLDSKPFEAGESWSDFYKQFNMQKGDIPKKYDELFGEGAFDQDFPDSRGVPNYSRFVNNAFTEKGGKYAFDPLYLSTEFPMSSATSMEPNKNDELDLGLKFLSTIQELSGIPFMVHRSHDKSDPRLKVKEAKTKKPKAVKEAAKEVETPVGSVVKDLTGFTKVSDQLGSNKGGLYKDPITGQQFYVKFGDKARIENEALASDIYKLAGINATDLQIGTLDGKDVIYSPWIEGTSKDVKDKIIHLASTVNERETKTDPKIKASVEEAQRGFAVDAWLANWDAVGSAYDNLVFDKDGKPLRVDPGGALLYRARGELKGDAFGDEVTELDTFTQYSGTPLAGNTALELFRSMPRRRKFESAKIVHKITPEQIEQLVDSRISDPETRKVLKDRLIARRQNIIERFSLEGLVSDKQEKDGDSYVDKVYYDDIRRSEELMAPGGPGGPRISTDAGDTSGYLDRYFDDNAPLVDEVDGNDIKEILQATVVKDMVNTVNKEEGNDSSANEVFRRGLYGTLVAQHNIVYSELKSEDSDFANQFPTFNSYFKYVTEELAISDKLLVGDVNNSLASDYKKEAEHAQSWSTYFSPEKMALQKKINRKYAEKILKLNPDGKIRIYRNANSQVFKYDTPEAALAGYWSFDRNFAWAFNSNQTERSANRSSYAGRYSALISVNEITGIIGMMHVTDYETYKTDNVLDEMPLSILPNEVLRGVLSDQKYHGRTRDLTLQSGATPRVVQTMAAGTTQWRNNRTAPYVLFNPVPFNLDELKSKAKEKGIDLDNVIDPSNGKPRSLERFLTELPDGRHQIDLFGASDDNSYDLGIYGTDRMSDFQKLMYLQTQLDVPLIVNNFAKDADAHKVETDQFYGAADPMVQKLEPARIQKFITVPEPTLDPGAVLSEADLSAVKKKKDYLDTALDVSKQFTAGDNQAPFNMLDLAAKGRADVVNDYRQQIQDIYDVANAKVSADKEAVATKAADYIQSKIKSAKDSIFTYEQSLKNDPTAKDWAPGAIKDQEEIIAELESGYDRTTNPGHEPVKTRITDLADYYLQTYDPEGSIREKLFSGASEQEVVSALENTPLWKERKAAFEAAGGDTANEWDLVFSDNDSALAAVKSAFAKDSRLSDEENETNRKSALEELRNGGLPVDAPATEPVVETPAVEAPEVKTEALGWDSLGGPTEGRGESELLDNLVDGDFLDVEAIKDGDVPRNFDLDDLIEEQAKSVRYYKGAGFRYMNNLLRLGQSDEPDDLMDKLNKSIADVDELIDTYGDVYTETTVFRGMIDMGRFKETDPPTIVEILESAKPGDILSDPGYTAATTNRSIAIREYGLGRGLSDEVTINASQEQWVPTVFFAIKLPEGSKALGLPLDTNYGREDEVVLPRGAQLKINAIRRVPQVDADGEETGRFNYFVDAENIPSEESKEEPATGKQKNQLIRLYNNVESTEDKEAIFEAVKDENLTAARAKELLEADYSPKPAPEVPKEMAERFFNPKYGAGDSKTDVAMLPIDEVEKYIVQDRAGKDSWGASSDATIEKITEELKNGGSIRDPLVIDFDDENNWGALAEGHHRLIAARKAGLKYVPVRILRAQGRNVSFKNKGKGAPLTFSAGPDKFGYVPGAAHASLFDQFAEKKPETKVKKLGNEPNVKASDEKVDMLISKISRLKIEDVEKLKEAIKNGTLTNELADELSSKAPGSLDILNDPVMLKAILKKHVGDSVTADDMQDLVDGKRTQDGYGFYHATNRELKVGDIIRPTESFAASASHGGLSFDIKKEMSPEEWEKKRAFAKLDGGQGVKGLSFYIARAAEMKGEPDGMGYFYRVKPVGTLSAFPSLEPEWVTDEGWEIVHVVGRASINDTRVDDRIHFDEDTDTLWHDNPEEYNSPDYGKRKTDDIIDTSSGDMPVLNQIIKTESTNEVGKGNTTLSADFDYVSYRKFDSSYLDEDEIEAITEYRAGGYAQINELLRTARLRNSEVPEEKVQKWIDTLDSAIDTWGSPMGGSVRNVVYRGQVLSGGSAPEVGEADMTEVINRLSPGMILEDRGFLSASTSPTIAYKEFGPGLYERGAVKGDTVFWAINVPEDVKGLFSPQDIGIAAEKEVIFHRNSKLAIKGVRKIVGQDDHARYFIEADMLAPESELIPKTREESSESSPELAETLAEIAKNREEPESTEPPKSAENGPSIWGRINLRNIKDSFKYIADDPEFSDLVKQYSGSDEDIDKLKEILTEKGLNKKNEVSDPYSKFTSAAEKEYKKIDPNLDTETGIAPASPYGGIEDSGLGTTGYVDSSSVLDALGKDGWTFNNDDSARAAVKKRISEEGFTSPVVLIYDRGAKTFSLKNLEADSDRIIAAQDLKRSTPVVVEMGGMSSNPRFFGAMYTPKNLKPTEAIKEDYPDVSGIPDLPTPSRSKEEKDAIEAYQKWGFYDLKTHMDSPYGHPDKSKEEREDLDKVVDNLDKLTSTEPIPDGTTLYRGVDLSNDPEWYEYFSELKAGDRLLTPTRFSSTTLDPIIADEYSVPLSRIKTDPENTKSVVIKITTGEGATGAAFENDKTLFSREKEVLLPLTANIEVTKVEKDSDGVIRVEGVYSKTPKVEKQIEEGGGFTLTPDPEDVVPEAPKVEENPYLAKSRGPIRNERDAAYRAGMEKEAKSKPIVSRLMELLNLNVSEVTDIQDQINKGDWKHENGSYSEAKSGAFSKYNKILVEFGEYEPSSSTYLKNGETGLATWLSDELGMDIKDLEIKQRTLKSGSTRPTQKFGSPKTFNSSLRPLLNGADYYYVDTDALAFYIYPNEDLKKAVLEQIKNGDLTWTGGKAGKSAMSVSVDKPKYAFKLETSPDRKTRTWVFDGTEENKKEFKEYIKKTYKQDQGSKVKAPKGSDFSAIGYSKMDSIKDFLDPANGAVLSIGDTTTNEEGKSVTVDEDFFLPNNFITYQEPRAVLRRFGSLAIPPTDQESLDPAEVAEMKFDWIEKNKSRFIYANSAKIEELALKKAAELGYTSPRDRTLYTEGTVQSVLNYVNADNKIVVSDFLDYVYKNYPEKYKNTERYEQLKKYSEFDSKLDAYAKDVAKANVTVAIDGLDLISVLEDGRLKNQFETGTSGGSYFPDIRIKNELNISGTPIDASNEKRPIFGHLTTFEDSKLPKDPRSKKNILHVASSFTKGYGSFKVIMKSSVKERTTFTAGDSMGGSQIAQVVSPNVDRKAMKLAGFVADPYTALNYTPESVAGYYVEAQIHGGVSLSDIERIIYVGEDSDEILQLVKAKLGELGLSIPLEILKLAQVSKE